MVLVAEAMLKVSKIYFDIAKEQIESGEMFAAGQVDF